MSPRIGTLRDRLTIEQEARTGDGGGGSTVVWDGVADVWGAVEALSGKETSAADRITGSVDYRITIRYRTDLTPAMRFRRGSDAFHILSVLDKDGERRFLTCQCERRDL